jgi:hypothetical protein
MSGSDLVLVRESAEDLFPADPVLGEVDWLRRPGVSLSRRGPASQGREDHARDQGNEHRTSPAHLTTEWAA